MGRTGRQICLFALSGIGRYCPIFRGRGAWTDLGGNGFFKAYQTDYWGLVNELQWAVLQKKNRNLQSNGTKSLVALYDDIKGSR